MSALKHSDKNGYDNMVVPVAPICNEFSFGYIYILKTLDSASAHTQYKLLQKMTKIIIFM